MSCWEHLTVHSNYKCRQFWLWAGVCELVVSVPFLLVRHVPQAALIGWIAVTGLFVASVIALDGHALLEMGFAALLIALTVAGCIYLVNAIGRERDSAATPSARSSESAAHDQTGTLSTRAPNPPLQQPSGGSAAGEGGTMQAAARS